MIRRSILLFLIWVPGLLGQNEEHHFLQTLISNYGDKMPFGLSLAATETEKALRLRNRFVAHLSRSSGPVVAYKAALTNPSAQKRFGVETPLLGMICRDMLKPNGSSLPVNFGTRPLMEGDLLVRIGHASINQATNHEEAMRALDRLIPFLELPDLILDPATQPNGPTLTAINLGSRLGVTGAAVEIQMDGDTINRLAAIQVRLLNEAGEILAEGRSSNLLGHPLNVVLWLRDRLQAEGRPLRKGDLLSLGSITPPVPVTRAGKITARYYGLSRETADVWVQFAEKTGR